MTSSLEASRMEKLSNKNFGLQKLEGKYDVHIDHLSLNGHCYYFIQEEPNEDLKFNYGL